MSTLLEFPRGELPLPSASPVSEDIQVIFQLQQILPIMQQESEAVLERVSKQEYDMPVAGVTQQEEALLKALGIFHYFTAEKLAEYLRYSPNSLRKIKKRLQQMEEKKLVEVANKTSRANLTPFVYTYGQEGHAHLKDIGEPVEGRYRPAFERIHKAYPLAHTLAVNEVLLKAMLLEEQLEYAVTLTDYRSEAELKAHPLLVQLPEEPKPRKLRPDLWLDFQLQKRRCLCVEVNLSKVWQRDWRELIRTYCHCLPAYEERFGTPNFTVAFIVASEADFPKRRVDRFEQARIQNELNNRLLNLLKWTELELTAQHLEEEADAFIFTNAPLLTMTPQELYFSPHWLNPFSKQPRSLMVLRKEAGSA